MSVFNESVYENLVNVTQLLGVASEFSSGTLGVGIWIMISFATLFITSVFSPRDSWIATGFISMMTAIMLYYLELLAQIFVFAGIVIFIAAIIMSISSKRSVGG